MIETVTTSWVESHLEDPSVSILDPRPPVKYFQGHIKNAVNFPVTRLLFSKNSNELMPVKGIEEALGNAGVDNKSTVVLYDSYDGQSSAMLAWMLDYLGHPETRLLDVFFERWISEGKPIFYRPVKPEAKTYRGNPCNDIRTSAEYILAEIRSSKSLNGFKLIDFRSPEEYDGSIVAYEGQRPGHIPTAVNLPWLELLGEKNGMVFGEKSRISQVVSETIGANTQNARIVCYCGMGPRAALGYVALHILGYKNISLYDKSYNEWSGKRDLPVE